MIANNANSFLTEIPLRPSAGNTEANGDSSAAPFFIVGLGRSGSTLLSRMLDANSGLAVFPETWCYVILDRLNCLREFRNPWQYRLFLHHVWGNLVPYNDPAARVWADEAAKLPSYIGPTAAILERFGGAYAKAKGARIWGEKTPGHILWLPSMQALFPKAKVIVTVRDPRDVIVSYDDRWGGGRRENAFLMNTAALIRYYLRRYFDEPGYASDHFYVVKYEDLTSSPVPVLQGICEFLGVDFQPSMVKFHDHAVNWIASSEAKHHVLLGKPATTARVARYKAELKNSQVAAIDEFLKDEMKALGYETDCASSGSAREHSEVRAIASAEVRYVEMQAGKFRRKMRRRGTLLLQSYRLAGRLVELLPARRLTTSSGDWLKKAASIGQKSDEQTSTLGRAIELDLIGTQDVDAGRQTKALPSAPGESSKAEQHAAKFRQNIGQISQHSAVFFAGTVFTGLAGYLFKVYLARTIGAQALGIYALGMTIVALVGVFNGLGLPQSAVRFVAHYCATGQSNQLRGFLLRALALLLSTNVFLAGAIVVAGPWVAKHIYHTIELDRYFTLFALIMLIGALTNFGGQVLQGYKDVSRRTLITNFIGTPLVIVLTVAFLVKGWGLWGYLLAQVVGTVIVLGLLVVAVRKLTPRAVFHHSGPLPPLGKQVMLFGATALGISILEFLLAQTDKILIGFYLNPGEVGIYAVAMTVVAFVPIALQSVNQIFSPTISDLHSRGEHDLLEKLFQTLTKWIFAFTLPLAIAILIFAEPLMKVFGSEFAVGWPVLIIGTLGQLFNCGTGSVGYLLLMSGNQNRLVRVQALMAVILITLDLLLIPKWGIMGAVLAAAFTNACTNLLNLLQVRVSLKFTPYNRTYLRLIPATILTVAATLWLRHLIPSSANLLMIMGCVMFAYFLFAGILLASGLDADDRLIADAVWSRVHGNWRRIR